MGIMTTYDYAIFGAIICGIIMVIGGILLLYKGAIKLEVASSDAALTLEMFERQFKLTTHAPALGLFIIGLLFAGLAIYFAQATTAMPIKLTGATKNIEEPVNVLVRSEWGVPSPQGQVDHVIRPHIDVLWVVITAPGYKPCSMPFSKEHMKGELNFGTVTLEKKTERIRPNMKNIAELPDGIKAPPITAVGTFGVGGKP